MGETDESGALKRSRFFDGRLLTPADLEREQQYVREKLKRHNRSLHGFGIVSGLKVTISAGQIIVAPGLALDCEGNELLVKTAQNVVPRPAVSDAPASTVWQTAYLNVRFVEELVESASDSEAEQAGNATVLIESFTLEVARENCNRGHRHLRARWLACGQPHALTIAKLRHRSQGWSVDRGYRPPSVK